MDGNLDRVGTGYTKYFANITFQVALDFVRYDVLYNDIFTVGGRVLRQKRGVAIGGTCSAQLAITTLWAAEHAGYPAITPVNGDGQGQHPGLLPVHPFRYVDNLVGVKYRSTFLDDILLNCQHICGLKLQKEAEGPSLKTLLSQLQVLQTNDEPPHIQMRMAQQYAPELPIEQMKYIFPDVLSQRARKTVHGLIPSMAVDAMYYRECESDIKYNVRLICADMTRKGYPANWW